MTIFSKLLVKSMLLVTIMSGSTGIMQEKAHASNNNFQKINRVASRQLGKRYRWGAIGPNSFDCSGLTNYTYRVAIHKRIPRTAQAQYNSGRHISYRNVQPGDLVFFGYSRYSIYHVGLYVGHGKMIDAQDNGVKRENVVAPWWHLVGTARVK